MRSLRTKNRQQIKPTKSGNSVSNRLRIAFVALSASAFCLGGCANFFDSKKAAPETIAVAPEVPAAPIALSAEAESTLKAAEQSVIESRIKRAMWNAANEQLALAKRAAKVFDSDATIKYAKEVIALCALSNQQMQSAPVVW